MANPNYIYLLHGSRNSGKDFVDKVFQEGIKSEYGYSIQSTLAKLDGDFDLNDEIIKYASIHEGTVFVARIPKEYFPTGEFVRHSDGSIDFNKCRPVFRKPSKNSQFIYFTPELIIGAYDYASNKAIDNPNYNEKFNARGLQYSEEVTKSLLYNHCKEEYTEATARRELSYSDLCTLDKANHKFEDTLTIR